MMSLDLKETERASTASEVFHSRREVRKQSSAAQRLDPSTPHAAFGLQQFVWKRILVQELGGRSKGCL